MNETGQMSQTSSSQRPTVADRVAQLLAASGAQHTFGVVGSGNFHLTEALIAAGVPFTAARHEGAAATMADAFTRLRDRQPPPEQPGFALVSLHQGCGLTNALTGIGEAAKSRTGMIVLAADTPADAAASNFDVDQNALARAVGAVARRLDDAEQLTEVIDDVVDRARRGATTVLSLPIDVQDQPAPAAAAPTHHAHHHASAPHRTGPVPPTTQVNRVAQALAGAERPVIVAGRGAIHASDQLRGLADATGALLATSAVAHGLFTDHRWNLGISGGFSSPTAAELISQADVVVAFGCALNNWTTRSGELIHDDATLIQIDTDPEAIGLHRPVSIALVADSGAAATALTTALSVVTGAPQPTGYRTDETAQQLTTVRWNDQSLPGGDLSTDTLIDPRLLSAELDRLLPELRVVTTDSGNFMGYPAAYLRVPDERGFVFTQAFQAIGLGLSTLIGAAVAEPDRLAILGTGDGGFAMNISELETLVRLQIPALVVIYNDAAYGAEVHHFAAEVEASTSSVEQLSTVVFPDTDFAAIARGYGADALTVRTLADLAGITTWLAEGRWRGVPLVIDAKIASDGGSWWLQEAFGH